MEKINLINDKRLQEVVKEYFNINNVISIVPYGNSPLKEKYLVTFEDYEYILQKINTNIFVSPFAVSHNIDLVMTEIKNKLTYSGFDHYRSICGPIKNQYGETLSIIGDEYWYCTNKIKNSTFHNDLENEQMAYSVGKIFGKFFVLLKDFNCDILDNNIIHIHDLDYLFNSIFEIYILDTYNRSGDCKKEIKFIKERKNKFNKISDLIKSGDLKYHVNCNMTMVSEMLFDLDTDEAVSYMNFDSVMKGAGGNDLGNLLRICIPSYKNTKNNIKVTINYDYLKAITKGFYEQAKGVITDIEVDSLFDNFYIVVIENAMVFLKEYLSNDKRVIATYPKENLYRCKKYIALLKEIEENEEMIKTMLEETCAK